MPVDYSKWDALELSDDSDIEVHPNVDKRSFIRAKQNQIHQQRSARKHRIATLRYEEAINDGLLQRVDALLKCLAAHKAEIEETSENSEVDEVVFQALADVCGDGALGPDQPPAPPEGVHTQQSQPSYSTMMGSLVDQVKTEVEKMQMKVGLGRYGVYIGELIRHQELVQGLQKDLRVELTKLEREEASKITSESIHQGFDSSHVTKATATPTARESTSAKPQLLNPSSVERHEGPSDSSKGKDLQQSPGEDDDGMEITPLAKQFAGIKFGDYQSSLKFLASHSEILAERETDGLLIEAFRAQGDARSKEQEEYARQCVHQALLIQYCRQLGKDGVRLFFQRVQTPNHQAKKMFLDDVNSTYARLRERTAELAREQEADGAGKEQIQLHAVEPGTQINIITPPPIEECHSDDEKASRRVFDSFPPGLQQALQSGSLEKVNEVLGKMSVAEAEQVVEQLGNGGMLSLEEGVIDTTTEEGQKKIEEIERTGHMPGKGFPDPDGPNAVEEMD